MSLTNALLTAMGFIFLISCGSSGDSENTTGSEEEVIPLVDRLFYNDFSGTDNVARLMMFDEEDSTYNDIGDGFYYTTASAYGQIEPVTVFHNAKVYFSASSNLSIVKFNPWVYDPNEPEEAGVNPKELIDLNSADSLSSNPSGFFSAGDYLFFSARTTANGYEPFIYDDREPVSATNPLLIDIVSGTGSSLPRYFTQSGDKVYFKVGGSGDDNLMEFDLNLPISPTNPSVTFSAQAIRQLIVVDGKIYFLGQIDTSIRQELYVFDLALDESLSNPSLIADINPTVGESSEISDFQTDGSKIYFTANDGVNGKEIWVFDINLPISGTNPDIREVDTAASSNINSLRLIDGFLYFSSGNSLDTIGTEAYIWDTSMAFNLGTSVKSYDLNAGTDSSFPWHFIPCFTNKICFSASPTAVNHSLHLISLPETGLPELTDIELIDNPNGMDAADMVFGSF